jgi:hypothetical protein
VAVSPFDFVNAINSNKKNLMVGTENDELAEGSYVPFIVNKSLSYFPDTILYANEMNQFNALDNKLQFSYLLNSIRPAKRFAKWVKREDIENVELIKQFYGYSTEKAIQVLSILTSDNLHYIKQKLERGGNDDNSRIASRGETKN